MCGCILGTACLLPLSSLQVGFLRFLSLVSTFDWKNNPLVVNLNGDLTGKWQLATATEVRPLHGGQWAGGGVNPASMCFIQAQHLYPAGAGSFDGTGVCVKGLHSAFLECQSPRKAA